MVKTVPQISTEFKTKPKLFTKVHEGPAGSGPCLLSELWDSLLTPLLWLTSFQSVKTLSFFLNKALPLASP